MSSWFRSAGGMMVTNSGSNLSGDDAAAAIATTTTAPAASGTRSTTTMIQQPAASARTSRAPPTSLNHQQQKQKQQQAPSSASPSLSLTKETLRVLYPRNTAQHSTVADGGCGVGGNHVKSRFSQLLLEHGESYLQDWAVMAESTPLASSNNTNSGGNKSKSRSNNSKNGSSPNGSNKKNKGNNNTNQIQWAQQPPPNNSNTSAILTRQDSPYSRSNSSTCSSSNSLNNNSNGRSTGNSSSAGSNSATRKNPLLLLGALAATNKKHQQQQRPPLDLDDHPSVHMKRIEGRLHLCSKSLVFEPTADCSRGVVRCLFSKMDRAPGLYPPDAQGFEVQCVDFCAKRHVVMKAGNVIGPFYTVHMPCRFRFTFLHSSPATFCRLSLKLYDMVIAGTTAAATTRRTKGSGSVAKKTTSSSSQHSDGDLDSMLKPMLERPFSWDNLVDVREQPLTSSLRASLVTPLQSKPGVLVLTAERIYFQGASGILSGGGSEDQPFATIARAVKWLQKDVAATARRYHGLRDSALEIYFGNDETSVLFAFERRHDREQVMRFLKPGAPCFTDRAFVVHAASQWQAGNMSNYDYLMALNSAAGRSFHQLGRYPVMPWVISDYESDQLDLSKESTFRDLSKPVGALNEQRLEYFLARLHGMQEMEQGFLYGTHYSAPGYVLYYLVRSMPEHMLCLQNGKFDAPDRMFHSISHCYGCVLTNHADVKELTPEFYNGRQDFDFLINARGLHLGATQNGDRVDDVRLPPWAKSARDFIKKNRKALESDICTRRLPAWLDLIFGCKSRGEAALEANNLFHPITYLGPTELAGMQSEEERFTAELQATEFGIVPDLLFRGPHPLRRDHCPPGGEPMDVEELVCPDLGRASSKDDAPGAGREAWELLDPPSNENSPVVSAANPSASVPSEDSHAGIAPGDGTSTAAALRGTTAAHRSESWAGSTNHGLGVQQSTSSRSGESSRSTSSRNLPLRGTGDSSSPAHQHRGDGAFASMDSKEDSSALPAMRSNGTGSSQAPVPSKVAQMFANEISAATATAPAWEMKIIEKQQIHGDTVSGCAVILDEKDMKRSILATTSLDGGLMVHKISLGPTEEEEQDRRGFSSTLTRFSYSTIMSRGQVAPSAQQSKLAEYRTHSARDPLASLVVASDGGGGHVAFAGGHDDVVLAYGINSACAVASVYSHRDAVTGLDLIERTPFDAESALWLENSTHIMVSASWDATVKVWSATVAAGETVSINREPLAELFDADAPIVCVAAKSTPGGGIAIGAGCADGSFCVWDVHSDGVQVVIHKEPARRGSGPCSVVRWVAEGGRSNLFAAFSTGKVASYAIAGGGLCREGAVSVGVAVLSLVYSEGVLLVGCADGGLRLIPVRNGTFCDAKPTLWVAVNNKSAPGISSISVTYHNNEQLSADGKTRCICCTGAEDGSVALFELRRVGR